MQGIGEADAHLGRRVPLPTVALPLARWVEVEPDGPGAVEVSWNLDDTREGAPGRLALHVALTEAAPRPLGDGEAPAEPVDVDGAPGRLRRAPLAHADASLRPVLELCWTHDGLHLRLTAQGPWAVEDVVRIAASVAG
ncbi:hypothetical protein [Conexibacter sp. SYSU D00693]|uniref:hypothetical protein n=1 Tax=Conexibacter sp. SYSU D00693 TaxID=2812560 RepID=UPI00196AC4C8|nr:hypothetical protein [Conexibacter sp. SYSU D00693]